MRCRGFEVAKGWEDANLELPTRSTRHAAGYDLKIASDVEIPPFSSSDEPTYLPTGLKVYCPPDECLLLINRSSSPKKGIVLANGVGLVDADYYNNPDNDGHFQILVYNLTNKPIKIKKGERIAQAVFQKFLLADNDQAQTTRISGFGSTDQTKLKIIFDVDDVLWSLTKYACQKCHIKYGRQSDFHLQNDPNLTPAEVDLLINTFCDPETFREMTFFDDIEHIFDVENYGAEVTINSNCYDPKIITYKRQNLLRIFPHLSEHKLNFSLVTPKTNHKDIPSDIFVFVDDSPYNIASSKAHFNLMPKKSWNTNSKARETALKNHKILVTDWQAKLPELVEKPARYVIPISNLKETNNFIQQSVKLKQEKR